MNPDKAGVKSSKCHKGHMANTVSFGGASKGLEGGMRPTDRMLCTLALRFQKRRGENGAGTISGEILDPLAPL